MDGRMFKRFKKVRPEQTHALALYKWAMTKSRDPEFYGPDKIEDNYDGRVSFLFLHLGLILHHLRRFGTDGEVLSQEVYNAMVADFDIALREQGVADTGVQRRIKAMVRLFYGRMKIYHEAAEQGEDALRAAAVETLLGESPAVESGDRIAAYAAGLDSSMRDADFTAFTLAEF